MALAPQAMRRGAANRFETRRDGKFRIGERDCMTDGSEQKENSGRKPLTLTRNVSGGTVRQSFSHGRTKQVAVEVREKRSVNRPGAGAAATPAAPGPGVPPPLRARGTAAPAAPKPEPKPQQPGGISDDEARRREDAVRRSMAEREARDQRLKAEEDQRRALEDAQRKRAEQDAAQQAELDALRRGEEESEPEPQQPQQAEPVRARTGAPAQPPVKEEGPALLDELGGRVKSARRQLTPTPVKPTKKGEPKRREPRGRGEREGVKAQKSPPTAVGGLSANAHFAFFF